MWNIPASDEYLKHWAVEIDMYIKILTVVNDGIKLILSLC